MKKIKIKSVYMSKIGKLAQDFDGLYLDAARRVLVDNDVEKIKTVYISSFAPTELCKIADPLRQISSAILKEFTDLKAEFCGPYKTGGEALFECLDRQSALEGDALILGCEKMTHLDANTSSGILAKRVNPHDRAYGATLPALGALVSRVYMEQYKIPYEAFHRVAVKNHYNGCLNPKAQFQKNITLDDVATSPIVSDPLRRLHCAPTSDGAVAVLLSSGKGDVELSGWGRGIDTPLLQDRDSLGRFRAAASAAASAFEKSKITRKDISVIEIHDAFSPFELLNLEELGFYPLGESWRALEDGELDVNSRYSVNPSGGLKARGHPIGVCGLSSLVEMWEQLTTCAGERQHHNARAGIIQSAGGVSTKCYVFIVNN
jgi:acetyl-CoA C-acetyltransferase